MTIATREHPLHQLLGKIVGQNYFILIYLNSISSLWLSRFYLAPLFSSFSPFCKFYAVLKICSQLKIYICLPTLKIYKCLPCLKIYICLLLCFPPHFSALISLWSVKLNISDQVHTLWTAWRWRERRGSWSWRCDWSTAGASAARVVKCAARVERGMCGG